MLWFFLFFLVSGFCGVLYEVVWLRLAVAQFGVTSAMVSIVLSMFMAGLGLGSWVGGRLMRRYENRTVLPALRIYAATQFLIGSSALLVPHELLWGRALLAWVGLSSSAAFYFASGLCVAIALIPWCACMGATIPVGMLAIRCSFQAESSKSFSYLYFSNVSGAVGGALLPPLFIEIIGFHGTLGVGMMLNFLLGISALALSTRYEAPATIPVSPTADATPARPSGSKDVRALILLFLTGLTSMGMEVVWIRQFTPYLGTMVYSFALILAVYFASTFLGSCLYRQRMRRNQFEGRLTWALLGLFAVLPVVMADPHLALAPPIRVLLGIGPFSLGLGFITPLLVDRWSRGDPDRAGTAYAVNVLGCILGPLLAGFLLLPYLTEHWVQAVFSLPWLAMAASPAWSSTIEPASRGKKALSYALLAEALLLVVLARDYEETFPAGSWILRDNTATVIAYGQGMQKRLLVNGVGVTGLTQITKMMAHLPLVFLNHPPQSALVICFGMGTSYRSLLSWGISATAAELVPSLPKMFPYFHPDAGQLLSSPRSNIVIDDGRRYLERSSAHYDVVTVDPPLPLHAAGSSLLYTKEFYAIIRQRLAPGGILQQWLPEGDPETRASVTRALTESFAYVRVFAYSPQWGYHFLASDSPIPQRSPVELAQRMPASAVRDIQEWLPFLDAEHIFLSVLLGERSPAEMIAASPETPAMQDDRPFNEYFLLRSLERGQTSLLRTSSPNP